MTRHEMRQSAFILTFERIFNTESMDEIIDSAKECDNIEIDNSVIALFKGVEENKDVIDAEISKHLKKWSLNRISKVSLAVLRLAMYEIMFTKDIDIDIIISEAVKIAQTFTLKDDVSFVNGVLSSVAKERK